ncbi:MAG: hypothetical protein UX08_C0012G0019 [Candidatus Collierbacteria bacterium GW2011_GWB1_45_35]|nr:MAG: hypothetical protein UX08_C0012G0019 [Candidatus Collierbacteria bacterium GW2011_GWB1_45_35]
MNEKLLERVKGFEETLEKFPEVRYAGDPVLRQSALEVTVEEGIIALSRGCWIW